VLRNIRLVCKIANKSISKKGSLSFDDLVHSGIIGLMKAIDNFNLEFTNRLSTYAVPYIILEIDKAIIETSIVVKIPTYLVKTIRKTYYEISKLAHKLERHPTDKEMTKHLEIDHEKLFKLRAHKYGGSLYIDDIYHGNRDERRTKTSMDLIGLANDNLTIENTQDNDISIATVNGILEECLQALKERERTIICMRFGLGKYTEKHTLDKIGVSLGITKERVRQLEVEILVKLKEQLEIRDISLEDILP